MDHVRGGLTVGGRVEGMLRLRAWPRIAILIQQLRCVPVTTFVSSAVMITFFFLLKNSLSGRRLLDAALLRAIDNGRVLEVAQSPVIGAMLALLTTDGMAAT